MHPPHVRRRALELVSEGHSLNSVAKQLGISRAAIREWRDSGVDTAIATPCPHCDGGRLPAAAYAALLGFYLGDGCISLVRGTYSLRIVNDARYPGITGDIASLMAVVRGRGPVNRVRAPGCVVVCSYWNHWPCLFPQHGPGRKHERKLTLEPWQEDLVAEHPAALLRGLFHSDGCRAANWATRTVAGETRRYDYPRWQFVNNSPDIRLFCTQALDRLAIPWRQSSWKTISVSRRDAVRRLDELVGPKR